MKGVFKRGENWYIDYRFQGRRVRKKIGTNKRLAETVLQKIKVQIAEGKYLDVKRVKNIKFQEASKQYLEVYSAPNKKSYNRDVQLVNNLAKIFTDKYLYEITPFMVEEYKKIRLSEVSPATVNREVACLKAMFNKAVEWKMIGDNPIKTVKLLRERNVRMRFLEKEEVVRFVDNCSEHLKPIVILAVGTGMRKGEILGLKWTNIDFNNNMIYLLDTKNGERREIPLSNWCRNVLLRVRKHPESPYVFCHKDGKPYKNVRKSFQVALKKIGVTDFRFHDLRHTFASLLVKAGFDLRTVQELLGHKSIDMVMRYAHLSLNQKNRAVEYFGRQMDPGWPQRNIGSKDVFGAELYSIENKELINTPR